MVKIVITGGPCAGKTTAMNWISSHFTKLGYTVLFVSETATELITGGVAPWTCGTNLDYQLCQMRLQLEKEAIYEQAAATMSTEKMLIVCDRGAMDNKAYMTDEEFAHVLRVMGRSEVELRDGYDGVFHLVTAAKGVEHVYTTANNAARTETIEQAAALDDRLIAAWTGHPHLRIIDNACEFEQKLERLLAEICVLLGEPRPMEIERKFLIAYPDIAWLESLPNCRRVEIDQTYLCAHGADEVRIRRRGADGTYLYTKTIKRALDGMKRVEIESRLTRSEYRELLNQADPTRRPIKKTRYCLSYDNQYLELDVYPFWKDRAMVEIELCDETMDVRFPQELQVLREVTDDPRYKNAALASITDPSAMDLDEISCVSR